MAFSFGNTSQPNFGAASNQQKSGTGFSFGAQTSTAPTSTTFGGFGTAATTSTPSGFGFGTGTSIPSVGFGGLGTTTTSTPSLFSGFGTTTTSAAPSAFGFGATNTTSSNFPGFGGLGTGSTGLGTFGGFGATTTSSAPLFGGLGTTTNTGSSLFGSTPFGAKPGGTAFGGFGSLGTGLGASTFGGTGAFGTSTSLVQSQQPPAPDQNQLIANAVLAVKIFGDERDQILAKWNLLQASWGTGKGYYSQTQPPVEFTPDNPYCRFKAIAYSAIPGHDNKEGLTVLVFQKKESEIKAQQQQILMTLNNILGNKPDLSITFTEIKGINDNRTQLTFYVEEKNQSSGVRRIPASELTLFLNQPMQKQQLSNAAVIKTYANVRPDADLIKEYLNTPPPGVDLRLWNQAQLDNPNPDKFIPVPVVGFGELKWRIEKQEAETSLHRAYLERVTEDITEIRQKHAASVAQISELRRKFLSLQHRVLRVLTKQEMTRKIGMALQPEEEQLRIQLENMNTQVTMPTQFRGRLTEMLAHIRILRYNDGEKIETGMQERYKMDPAIQDDIKNFLKLEQAGINHLIQTVNTDLENLNLIKTSMLKLLQGS